MCMTGAVVRVRNHTPPPKQVNNDYFSCDRFYLFLFVVCPGSPNGMGIRWDELSLSYLTTKVRDDQTEQPPFARRSKSAYLNHCQ